VPHCNPVLEGLCRQQSEFIPVLSLANLLQLDNGAATAVGTQLITLAGMHPWATRISEAIGIETIESIDSSNHDRQTLAGGSMPIRDAVLGTSVFRDHVARILNPNQIYELALHALEHDWRQHGINRQSSRQMVDVR
jgi:chemotaxis signal transduction protein